MEINILLPDIVEETEDLARIICAGSKRSSYKNYFDYNYEDKKYDIKPTVFMDDRNPVELSVNRISTLDEAEADELGLKHRAETGRPASYNGYAKIQAKNCFDHDCKVLKDDYDGLKPYHANIIYPALEKELNMSIAIQLAFRAELVLYKDGL